MRCHICDKTLTEPMYNRDFEDWEPCPECMEVVQDVLNSFKDRPSVDEDELGLPEEIPLESIASHFSLDNSD